MKLGILVSPLGPVALWAWRSRHRDPLVAVGRREGWSAAAKRLLSDEGRSALPGRSVHLRLREAINTDIETELLWTAVRRELLLGGTDPGQRPELWELVVSLVRQCANNEYVWYVSEEERAEVERRAAGLAGPGSAAAWGSLAVLAAYRGLETLLPQAAAGAPIEWPEGVPSSWSSFVDSCLADHREERHNRESVPAFGAITRDASAVVARTYEEHPYPRWLDWEMARSRSGQRQWLGRFFDRSESAFVQRPFRMLVAGCGTGAKAIAYALGYGPRCSILAIDLSRASLAYALRMAHRYGARNIEFLQMDLLDLPRLGRTFDFVESTGVLHHLQDPTEGGKALAAVLREGGIAHISLYSELSRREIVRLRKPHEGRIGHVTDEEVRSFRWHLLHEDPELIDERLPLRWDFFDMNRCRDLLFHPQEHRFTLPEVEALLEAMGLDFRGLQDPGIDPTAFWTRFPRGSERRSLASWHAFELAHPDAFGDLYEIWAIKRGTGERRASTPFNRTRPTR